MSTIVATKVALADAIGSIVALSTVQVSYGDDVARPKKERVFMGDVETHDMAPATMRAGNVRTEENYAVRVIVLVDKKGGHQVTEERALVILSAIQALLATDPKLSTAAVPPSIAFATAGPYTLSTSLIGEGEHRTIIEMDVNVKARNA